MAKPINLDGKRIIISRTDSIGDVMLTFPICAWIKKNFKETEIIFLGKGYTRSVVEAYEHIDRFVDWNDYLNTPKTDKIQWFRALEADAIIHVFPDKEIAALAKKARIPVRVGTSHRAYHLVTCTHWVNFTRKNSELHEAQLNHELLRPFGLNEIPSLDEIVGETEAFKVPKVELPKEFADLNNFVILHPKSQGSAMEWPIDKYMSLANRLNEDKYKVVFTGTEKEGALFRKEIPSFAIDSTGKLSLDELMVLISKAKALVACSTGPLHIAGYEGVKAVGLFSPRKPIHPGRWKALGKNVNILVKEDCPVCKQKGDCDCITQITVEDVLEKIG